MEQTIDDVFLLMKHTGMPEMLVKNVVNGFELVPFRTIIAKTYNHDYEPWPYAFVNKDLRMYKIIFSSFDDLVETLFNAKEICHGNYPNDAQVNPLYGKCLEQLKIEHELTKL